MTTHQILAFAIVGAMMILFIWGKWRYDVVAGLALLASIAAGTVPPDKAFRGFSDDIVVIVGSALVISAAVARSGVVEALLTRFLRRLRRVPAQLLVLVGSVTFLSALVKNIGALAILMPAALRVGKAGQASASTFLMPMAFGSLLGGLITLVGTSPNIIVSRVREQTTGQPFGMFDYAAVGLPLALMGLLFLVFGYRLLPRDRHPNSAMGEALNVDRYVTEAKVPATTEMPVTVAALREGAEDDIEVVQLLSAGASVADPAADAEVRAGDRLVLRGDPEALERAIAKGGLELVGQDREAAISEGSSEVGVIEAVIMRESVLVGQSAGRVRLHERYGVNLLAVSRAGQRLTDRLRDLHLCPGDVLVLQGALESLPDRLTDLGCLPLAERDVKLGGGRKRFLPLLILGAAMALTATGAVPVAVAFFAAAVLVMATGAISPREAYRHIEWPILIMLGALIPVSEALQSTGGTGLIANALSDVCRSIPAWAALGVVMIAAMAVTPFLNNAATVLVMAPIGVALAQDLNLRPEAFLMAVAVGAGCDFLTPIGHQCNTLVMGPGGYRFSDYARLGAPLSILVVLTAVPLILAAWPLK
jgi:di/tricarboxylate transporter